jgi:hypothetical protein
MKPLTKTQLAETAKHYKPRARWRPSSKLTPAEIAALQRWLAELDAGEE